MFVSKIGGWLWNSEIVIQYRNLNKTSNSPKANPISKVWRIAVCDCQQQVQFNNEKQSWKYI
jgi:hypothetical protein